MPMRARGCVSAIRVFEIDQELRRDGVGDQEVDNPGYSHQPRHDPSDFDELFFPLGGIGLLIVENLEHNVLPRAVWTEPLLRCASMPSTPRESWAKRADRREGLTGASVLPLHISR